MTRQKTLHFYIQDNICVKDMGVNAGTDMINNYISPYSAAIVEQLTNAGGIIAGRVTAEEIQTGGPLADTRTDCHDTSMVLLGCSEAPSFLCRGKKDNFVLFPSAGTLSEHGVVTNTSSLARVFIGAKDGVTLQNAYRMLTGKTGEEKRDLRVGKWTQLSPMGSPALYHAVFDIIASVETSSNLAKYDGVRYGCREEGRNPEEMYVNSRSLYFDTGTKHKILLGNLLLSKEFYQTYYQKAVEIRQQMKISARQLFATCDVIEGADPMFAALVGAPVLILPDGTVWMGREEACNA